MKRKRLYLAVLCFVLLFTLVDLAGATYHNGGGQGPKGSLGSFQWCHYIKEYGAKTENYFATLNHYGGVLGVLWHAPDIKNPSR